MDLSEKQHNSLPSPMAEASFLSRLTFWWLNGLFSKGYDRRLEPYDLYQVLKEDSAETLVADLESEWSKEVAAAAFSARKPSLGKAVARFAFVELIYVGVFGFLNESIRTVQPILLFYLVSYFIPNSSITKLEAYFYAMAVTVASTLSVILHQLDFFNGHRAGMHLRIATTGCVFRKSLRLGQGVMTGHVVNLVSTDTQSFDQFVSYLHFLWITPVQMVATMYLLWIQLGVSCFVPLAIMLLLILYQSHLGRVFAILRLKTARLSDERCNRMNEIISGVRVVKISTWELSFSKLIKNLRRFEISKIRKAMFLRALNMAVDFASQNIISCITFAGYVLLGNTLTAAKVFSSIAFLNALQRSVTRHFPPAVQKLNEAKITVKRIQEFLELDELSFEKIQQKSNRSGKSGVTVHNVTCSWSQERIDRSTLQDISFKVGMSSLLMMLLGELCITDGSLQIKGRIGYVPQQAWIFSGSVRQNIVFGQTFEADRYDNVIKVCCLEKDIDLLPEGDLTLIGEKGVTLSGGQKARVCLARAVYFKADIYILDDPLSAVDVRVGRKLFDECIDGLLRQCPRVLVTHQLQYLRNATEILYLEKGKIHSRGSYTDLVNAGIDLVSLLRVRNDDNDDDNDDKDSAIDEDSEPVQPYPVHDVIFRRGGGAKGMNAFNRWSTASSIDIEADFEAMASKAKEKPQVDTEERPRGSIAWSLYVRYFRAGGNDLVLLLLVVLCVCAQGVFTLSDWWLSQWSNSQGQDLFVFKFVQAVMRYPMDGEASKHNTHMIIYGGLVTTTLVLSFLRVLLFFHATVTASVKLHNNMFDAVIRAPVFFFDTNPTGRILNRFSSDTAYMDTLIPETFLDFLQLGLLVVAVVSMNVITMPFILVGVVPLILVFCCLRNYYLKTTREIKRLEGTARSPVLSHLVTTLDGLTSIRSHSLQDVMIHEFNICQDRHTETWFLFIATSRWLAYRLDFLCMLFVFMASFTPLFIAERGEIDAGLVGLCLTYAVLLPGHFQWCVRQSAEVENQMTSVERIMELCCLESEGNWHGKVTVPATWPELGLITAESVSFKYHPTLPRVLKNVNFCIRAQEKVGIVGRTGAGKSSLLAALLRLADSSGTIRIDGIDISELGLHELRSRLSVIPQDPVLFSGTLRKNLDPFDEYSEMELWRALQEVQLSDMICSLTGGLDGLLTESGSNLSVGQRQLICLARAILRGNKILIMDEATANVDQRTDSFIQETIKRRFQTCTVLTIAHRLKTIMDCDRVMVLDNGRLKEFDEPHLLLQNRWGHFYRLVQHTGSLTSIQLALAARQAFLLRHQPQASYAVPDASRSYLSSYIPISGFTDLQLESCV
ncbi:multidrug resistance-associated protein 4-like isoform X2 [Stylophora pistillata]|uniref:multidrug resistance-associated protein 4-like isoform X2 n=1 Tax=Stylophora pistillata TaxID=50429 RepID=UPI000C040B0B|nr:multidrug resistance-associated protein 4-like isoform X2 [Stylophora pistillata]